MTKKKPSNTQRGYGAQHKRLRKQLKPIVEAGQAFCWRCIANGKTPQQARINPNEPWDLGHDDDDRTRYRGPEHQACNRNTAKPKPPTPDTTRNW